MIRINLAPEAARAKSSSGGGSSGSASLWGFIYLFAAIVLCGIFAFIYFSYDGKLQLQRTANRDLQTRIDGLRERSSGLEEVQAALESSQALESTVRELNTARTGPVRAIMELNRILTRCPPDEPNCERAGPTVDPEALEQLRRDNPYATFNRSWDVRRLWLTHFEEAERVCRMRGLGRTNEDVAEFLRRLSLSELFDQVSLTRTEATVDRATNVELIEFELNCQVIY